MARFPSIAASFAAGVIAAAAASIAIASHGEEIATIAAHSQRYGAHIGISAYDDPLLKGVTCYVSAMHADSERRRAQPGLSSDAAVSCVQVGNLSRPPRIPVQAKVFDESVAPVFKAVHVIRIVDSKRLTVLYFSYTESDEAGNQPGHVDIIRLPARGKPAGE
jgi:CreA protein